MKRLAHLLALGCALSLVACGSGITDANSQGDAGADDPSAASDSESGGETAEDSSGSSTSSDVAIEDVAEATKTHPQGQTLWRGMSRLT